MPDFAEAIQSALSERFGERLQVDPTLPGLEEAASSGLAARAAALSRARHRAGPAAHALRLRPVSALEERYAKPQRADFGAFVRGKGFHLD